MDTTKGNHLVSSPVSFRIIGLVLIMIGTSISIFIKCPPAPAFFALYVIFGLGISLVIPKSADTSTFAYKIKDLKFSFSGGVAIIALMIWQDPISKIKTKDCIPAIPQVLTVYVHGKKGSQDLPLVQKGRVMLDILHKERKNEHIDTDL
jgi:hypothetical protein